LSDMAQTPSVANRQSAAPAPSPAIKLDLPADDLPN